MAQIEIDFEWQRDSRGYRLLEAKLPTPRRPPLTPLAGLLLAGMKPAATTILDGYEEPQRVVRVGGDLKRYRPLEEFETLYQIFANTAQTPAGVLSFIEKFGPLTEWGLDPKQGENVELTIKVAAYMAELLRMDAIGHRKALISRLAQTGIVLLRIKVSLIGDPIAESLKLHLGVQSLMEALWLQFGQAMARGATVRQCQHCSTLFQTGPGSGRRLDAKFCSDDHRVTFNSLKRTKEK